MQHKINAHPAWRRLLRVLITLAALGLIVYLSLYIFLCYQEAHVPVDQNKADAYIVLGAQVQPSGEPSIQLQYRLEAALKAWQASPALVVVSGGQGGSEPRPEGDTMRDWLKERGVPSDQILVDNVSVNTRQNITHAVELLAGQDVKHITIITSDYHLPRALAIARDAGLDAGGIGSPCKQEFWLKNHMREVLAWAKYWGQKYLHLPLE